MIRWRLQLVPSVSTYIQRYNITVADGGCTPYVTSKFGTLNFNALYSLVEPCKIILFRDYRSCDKELLMFISIYDKRTKLAI